MKKFVQSICYFINMYIFFIVICGFMTAIPNLNMNFIPLKVMFLIAGFGYHTKPEILGIFIPLIMIISLIALRKILYKIIGEEDKFFGCETTVKKDDKDKDKENENNNEGIDNDSENNNSSDSDN